MKNLEFAAVLPFAQQVQYQKGQVVSKTIAQSKALSLTLFAFDKGEEIGTHASDGDASVSYTHLDVYKRQPLHTVTARHMNLFLWTALPL